MSLVARGIFRRGLSLLNSTSNKQNIIHSRHGHVWSYRTAAPKSSKGVLIAAEVVGAYMWWWILWHLWTEPEHVTGEFPYPDPSKWTDAELGIPPDDVE